MEYRQLGAAGAFVSRIGLDTATLEGVDQQAAERLVGTALDAGVTFVQAAESASGRAEEVLGRVLGDRRRDIVLAAGLRSRHGVAPHRTGQSRLHVSQALDDTLRRLRTDHVDLYRVHGVDPCTPVEETLLALDDAVHQGKVRYVACSGLAAWRVTKALGVSALHGLAAFVAVESPYGPEDRQAERDLVPMVMAENLALVVTAGTAGTTTAGVAAALGATPAQVALAWQLTRQAVTCALATPAGVDDTAALLAAADLSLPEELRSRLDGPPAPGFAAPAGSGEPATLLARSA
ncbi:aldo/keto reductase [Pseudonocardia sp. CA-107938]|uniref:aldo/keto reductase n=1 Tax=Pseudonocardia sp. CA-107938 TaxID=3240021 RepID=UPI003D8D2DEE